ncbi:MAG TPA: hypothetical protein VK423_06080 [Thermoplasmata archaeon]|nr:hypothetical protein [Thermoplasmata archaeon]
MADWFNTVTWVVFAALSGLNLLVLLFRTEWGTGVGLRAWVLRALRKVSGRDDVHWLDWRPFLVAGTVAFAAVSAYGILSGQYGCNPPGVSDPIGILNSGKAFLAGQNPFRVSDCGGHLNIPYGIASVLLSALGSPGGLPGIYAVWGAVALALIPLTWVVAGPDRRYVLVFVATSVLLVPLVSSQIDGATNALVPTTVLLSLYLARRSELLGAAVGGFFSTARFPNLLPILGESGSFFRRRYLSFVAAVAVFGGATGLTYAVWGHAFLDPVFLQQLGRRSFSLNVYGILLISNTLPGGLGIEAVQAGLVLALLIAVFFVVRSPIVAASIMLVGFALLTPFLSFNILVWLLPVALVGARARWWLWSVAIVGSVNYDLALNVWYWDDGVGWPSMIFDVVLTALLLGMFVDLWRGELAAQQAGTTPPASTS